MHVYWWVETDMGTICWQQNHFHPFLNSQTGLKTLRFGFLFDRRSEVLFGSSILGSSTQETFQISVNRVGAVIFLRGLEGSLETLFWGSFWPAGKLKVLQSYVGCFVFMAALFTAFTFIVYSNHSSQKPSPPTLLPPSSKSKPQQAASIVHYSIVSPPSSCKSSPTGLSIMQPKKGIFYWDFHLSHSV